MSLDEGGERQTDCAVQDRIEAAREAARVGNLTQARQVLLEAAGDDPTCAEAWLGLAWLAGTEQERERLLKRVLELDPGNAKARTELERLARSEAGQGQEKPAATRRRSWWWAWVLVALAAVGLGVALFAWGPVSTGLAALITTPEPTPVPTPTLTPAEIAARFVPQLQAALDTANWDRAHDLVAIMDSVDPSSAPVKYWALLTSMRHGQALVSADEVDQALLQFDQALSIAPADAEARTWQRMTQGYLAGRRAIEAGDYPTAIQALTALSAEAPDYADVAARLVEAYRRQGQAALEAQEWPKAIESFGQALERTPGDAARTAEGRQILDLLLQTYQGQGQAALEAKDWKTAIDSLTVARKQFPEDTVLLDLLVRAHRNRGIAEEEQGKLKEARADLEATLALRPGDSEAKTHLAQVMLRLFPPKRIEIDIGEQRMYVYEGKKLQWKFLISTGLPGRDTATGHYQVLDKIPMAYSSIWRLKMPYWLGIYYVGRIENGIHALPIRPDGSVMWGGLLGTKQSYGCVILNNQNARMLYNWADIGTAVDIHY